MEFNVSQICIYYIDELMSLICKLICNFLYSTSINAYYIDQLYINFIFINFIFINISYYFLS